MAFTFKVVILLLVSSLGWWQASAKGDSAETIIEGLNNITAIIKATKMKVTEITTSNVNVQLDREVIQGINNITNTYVQANNTSKMVLGQLTKSDVKPIVKALFLLLVTQRKLLEALAANNTVTKLKLVIMELIQALESLRGVAVGPYLADLHDYLFPLSSAKSVLKFVSARFNNTIAAYSRVK